VIEIRLLTPSLRKELKAPLGLLIRGSFRQTMHKLRRIIEESKPVKIIAVGDRVSENMLKSGLRLDLAIVDSKVMRKPIKPLKFNTNRTFHVSNPAGTLTDEACETMEEALSLDGQVRVLVEGEEDLLTLAVVLAASEGSLVVYGQPKQGIVIISVTGDSKRMVQEIVDRMEISKH
jgi:uncharacterized protein (UPF0218 family)